MEKVKKKTVKNKAKERKGKKKSVNTMSKVQNRNKK